MTTCFRCSGQYRLVYRDKKFLELDIGTDLEHWRTCKGRKEIRKPKQAKLQLVASNHRASKEITGPGYRPSCPDCPAPPFEPCPCYPEAA
jgi:hypothetical protein